jgi:hypothetical protein
MSVSDTWNTDVKPPSLCYHFLTTHSSLLVCVRIYSIAKSGVSATSCRVCACVHLFVWILCGCVCVCVGCSTRRSTLRTEMQGISSCVCVCGLGVPKNPCVCVHEGKNSCVYGGIRACVCDKMLFRRNSCVCVNCYFGEIRVFVNCSVGKARVRVKPSIAPEQCPYAHHQCANLN